MDKRIKVIKISEILKKRTKQNKEDLRQKIEKKLKEARRIYDGE